MRGPRRQRKDVFRNWSGTVHCAPAAIEQPTSEDEIAALVHYAADAGLGLKCVGAGHSWNDSFSTDGILVNLDRCARVLEVDATGRRVTVEAGIRLKDLNAELGRHGLSMRVLGSISEQSIAGATATATHGSGLKFGNLSTSISALRLVDGRGRVHDLDARREPELFRAARVGLGALGVVSQVTVECEPLFNLEERAEPLGFEVALERLPKLLAENDFLKLWWLPHTDIVQAFAQNRTGRPRTPKTRARRFEESALSRYVLAAALRYGKARPSAIPALNRAVAERMFQRRHRVDEAVQVFNVPQVPVHREMEYAVALEYGVAALHALRDFIQRERLPVNFIVEARFVAADDNMMSPAFDRESCQIGAYMFESEGIDPYFSGFEQLMLPMGGRPHWGKEFSVRAASIREMYPEFDRFNAIRRELDPNRVFENDFVRRVLVE